MAGTLSQSQARRIALTAQGFGAIRPAKVNRRHLLSLMKRLNLIQLDSVPVIIRTQYMPGFSRLGPYRTQMLDEIAYRDDQWFEAWSHEASLVPVETEPWLRWNKARNEAGETWRVLKRLHKEAPEYIEEVYAEVADRGPLGRVNSAIPAHNRENGGVVARSVAGRWIGCFESADSEFDGEATSRKFST